MLPRLAALGLVAAVAMIACSSSTPPGGSTDGATAAGSAATACSSLDAQSRSACEAAFATAAVAAPGQRALCVYTAGLAAGMWELQPRGGRGVGDRCEDPDGLGTGTITGIPLAAPQAGDPAAAPATELYVYDVVQEVDEASLCGAALRSVGATEASCATVADEGSLTEPAVWHGETREVRLRWDFRVLVVAPESCYVVDVAADPEVPLDAWSTAAGRVGLQFGSSSLPPGSAGRCPEQIISQFQ